MAVGQSHELPLHGGARGTQWHENGQKQLERHYKDGKQDGLETWWHENGQKSSLETHYKDGVEVEE